MPRLGPLLRGVLACVAFLALFAALSDAARASPIVTDNVTAELVSGRLAAAPGETVNAALRLRVREGWHTYWRNPGDSGAPTTLSWAAPAGWNVSDILWPAPFHAPFGPLMNYGFEGETLYPLRITVPADAPLGQAVLSAEAEWLVCKDICIPEGGRLELSFEIARAGADDPSWARPIAAALDAAPRPAPGVSARISPQAEGATLSVVGGPLAGASIETAAFFPFDGALIDHAAPQGASLGPQGLAFSLKRGVGDGLGRGPIAGVLVYEVAGDRRAIEIAAEPGAALAGAGGEALAPAFTSAEDGEPRVARSAGGLGLPAALVFAFLGGIILNLMPCVFPVLSLKALALARGAQSGEARRHGLVFTAGVMATFLALGATIAAFAAAGQVAGWGFQLQNPIFVGGLALLFFAIGLNLLGAFELGGGLQGVGGALAERRGDAGAFFTGALAVVAATPCTAPFMAGALGFAASQPPATALLVFAALGAGFAAPMLGLSLSPALLGRLPKPGPWMETAKQFFAFPMFAAAVWLTWVLAAIAGQAGLLALLAIATAFAFAIWALRAFKRSAARYIAIGVVSVFAAGVVWASSPRSVALIDEPWSAERVAALTGEGRPVFVNFTADWCVTCKVNERVALSSEAVAQAFAGGGVVYLKADWTARDDVIARELARHGRTGVPLYLFYAEGSETPVVLDQLLTPQAVIAAIRASTPPPGA